MSLKNTPGGRGNQMGEAYAGAQQRQGAEQQERPRAEQDQDAGYTAQAFSLPNFSASIDLPLAANQQSEILARMRAALENEIKLQPDPNWEIRLEGLDRDNPNLQLGVSVLVVCVMHKVQRNLGIGYYSLLLQASAPTPPANTYQVGGGRTVELEQTTGDAYDGIMRDEIRKELSRLYPGVPLHSNDARVIYSDFDLNDSGLLKRLRGEVVTAAGMAVARSNREWRDLQLKFDNVKPDTTLSLQPTFGNQQLMDAEGQPIRADVRIAFRAGATPVQQGNRSQNLEKPKDITTIAGYIDLIHEQRSQVNQWLPAHAQYSNPAQAAQQFQQFMARLVITQMRSLRPTLGQQLLALVTVYALRKPGAWYPNFRPSYHQSQDKHTDLKDIGVLTIEAVPDPTTGVGVKTPTKIDTFRKEDLGEFLYTFVKPGLVVSMDVDECGDDTWMNNVFAAAAAGDVKANNLIYDAADYLTNGQFGTLFAKGAQICFTENNRIHRGYYSGPGGERRDGRDLDYVAMMNLSGERDLKFVRDWNATYLQSEYPLEQRLAARYDAIKAVMPDFKLTGYATRVTFADAFLQALTAATAATGLAIREVSGLADQVGYEAPQYRFADQALGGYQATSLFTQGYAQSPQGYTGQRVGRWG